MLDLIISWNKSRTKPTEFHLISNSLLMISFSVKIFNNMLTGSCITPFFETDINIRSEMKQKSAKPIIKYAINFLVSFCVRSRCDNFQKGSIIEVFIKKN